MPTIEKQATATMVPLGKLQPARGTKYDVRKGGNGDISELKASIKSMGLLIPLAVKTEGEKLIVVAGNRRLAALQEIYKDKPNTLIQTVSADEFSGDTRVLAMATNIVLPPHPIERYEVISALVKEGMTPAEAQERFALSDKVFRQTMRLGQLAPAIIEAYRSGEIDGETARAFALTEDVKAQAKLYTLLKRNAHNGRIAAYTVHQKLAGSHETGKLVAFVGVETVAAAGILKSEDLFGTRHDVTDQAKLKKMAEDKMNGLIGALTTADTATGGWGWAAAEEDLGNDRYYYGREEPASKGKPTADEKDEIAKIAAALSNAPEDEDDWSAEQHEMHRRHGYLETLIRNRGFTAEQKARSGCILSIDHDGNLKIEYGRTKPKPSNTSTTSKSDAPAKKDVAKKPGEVAVISNRLAERMSTGLQEAVAGMLQHDPRLAVAALVAAFASGGKVLNVRVGNGSAGTDKDFISVFEGTSKATMNELASMLMKVATSAVNIVTFNAEKVPLRDEPALAALLAAMKPALVNAEIRRTFEYEDYFNSISVAGIADAVRTAQGDAPGDSTAKMAKKNAVQFALQTVPGTGWLPKELRSVHYDGPVEAVPAKKAKPAKAPAKKAAPAKKVAKKAAKKKAK